MTEEPTCAIWDDEPERVSIEDQRAREGAEEAQAAHEARMSRVLFERFGGHFDRNGRCIIPFKLY